MWFYKGERFDKLPNNKYGFVYEITYESGMKYRGKKSFYSITKKKFGKKQLSQLTDKRMKKYEIIVKESNWKKYAGSCKEIAKGDKIVSKEIIGLANSQHHLTYLEYKYLFEVDACINENYYNKNIASRFYDSIEKIAGEYLNYKGSI